MDEPIDGLSVEITHGLEALDVEAPPSLDLAGITGEVARAGDRDGPSPPMPFAQEIAVLDTMPGVDAGAELLVAEWDTDMRRLGTARCLSAWTGVAPWQRRGRLRQRSGNTRRGHYTLRTGLTPMPHAAARAKGSLCRRVPAPGSSGPEAGDHSSGPCHRRQCASHGLSP